MNQQVITKDNIFIPPDMYDQVVSIITKEKDKTKLFKFSYQDLLKLSFDFDYQKANQFRQKLANYSDRGSYYILFCQYDKRIYQTQLELLFSPQKIKKIYDTMYSIYGITKFGFVNKSDQSKDKNCLTILNKTLLQLNDWKGILQHQMTHFIQRIIGLDQTVQIDIHDQIDIKNLDLTNQNKIYQFAYKIALFTDNNQQNFIQMLKQKFLYMLNKSQIQETIKSLLLMFRNMYERQITYQNGKIKQIEIKNQSIQDRLNWLKQFLDEINSIQYLESQECKNSIQIWKKQSILCNEEELIKHRYISYIMVYLAFKNILPTYNIDQQLYNYFKTF